MILALILVIPMLTAEYALPDEPDVITDIRAHYSEVKSLIDEDYALYTTTVLINPSDVPYPAVGDYFEKMNFYWDISMEYGERNLLLVIHTSQHAAHSEYHELLFETDGSLAFIFSSTDNGDEMKIETRRWYSDGTLLHSTECLVTPEGTEFVEPGDDPSMRTPEYYLRLFEAID